MKRTDSTEMDRLLRRHFRRNGETLSDVGASAQESKGTSHMDADEMNAYAEGALPEAARSRYFAHLADCDDCRKLVTDLTLAYGAVSKERRAAAQEPSPSKSWREWLASLLSPPVIRYGVPSLALLAVIIVAIVALRARREEPSYMAQNKEAARNSALSTSSAANSSAESSTATTAEDHANANASSSNSAPATVQQPQPDINPAATPIPPPTKATMEEKAPAAPPSVAAKTEAQSGGVLDTKQEDRPREDARSNNTLAGTAAAPPPASPAAKPEPADADDMAKRDEEQRKKKATTKDQNETVEITNSGGAAATTQTTSAESPRERRVASRAAQSLPVDKVTVSGRAGVAVEKESSSETRTVGGRNFRRQGSAWVDTSYNSSRTTINIARGSEQYRALLADEPGLRTITKQLGGEVIVVWGSKAYRFY